MAFPSTYRKGDVPAEIYHRQAKGEMPIPRKELSLCRFIRSIRITDGNFDRLASDSGALLTFVVAGKLELTLGTGETIQLAPGHMFLTDDYVASHITAVARDNCRLVQIGVAPDWPGADAKLHPPGTMTPYRETKVKRFYTGEDNRTYFREFPEAFSSLSNEWSAPRPANGFHFLCWEDGFIDLHPEVVNNFTVFLSGELGVEVGGDRKSEIFHAGDICLATDRTGEGHITWCRGVTHVAIMVMSTENLW